MASFTIQSGEVAVHGKTVAANAADIVTVAEG